ncbi:MAG: fimbrial biogenesis outer membrane usher protein [Burkholderiales bacterium]|nr:fimbrial biogenesis outer membrane usher protein [Burkholderiales bacterium]
MSPISADEHVVTMLLGVNINGVDQEGTYQVIRLGDGTLAVLSADLNTWRLRPEAEGFEYEGQLYHALAEIAGVEYHVDDKSQVLMMTTPATAFSTTVIAPDRAEMPVLTESRPGAFFNYDVQTRRNAGQLSEGGLFELGAFNNGGVGTSTFLWNSASPYREFVRLDTTWARDLPDRMESLRAGDLISRGGAWGRSVRLGGLQWSSNFSTRPNFIAFPLPSMQGEAVLPSTIDVYVNNVRRLSRNVPPGPFEIPEVPLVTGQGDLRLVVRDVLGRQQVITQPYYASPQLLRPGLHDFSYEVGAVRENYTLDNAAYGRAALVMTDRLGITDRFTREFHGEVLTDQQTGGAGLVWLWPQVAAFNANVAASSSPMGGGRLVSVGMQRQALDFSIGFQAQFAERDFVQIGTLPGFTPQRTVSAQFGMPLAGSGFSVTYLDQRFWDGGKTRLLSANYSIPLGRVGQLGFYAIRNDGDYAATTVGFTFIYVLDPRTTASVDVNRNTDAGTQPTVQLQRNVLDTGSFGYRLLAGGGQYERQEASGTWRTQYGDYSADVGSFNGNDYERLGATGGIAFMGGTYFSRRIDNSFAVVRVGNYRGVRVYRDNREVGRTRSDGTILIPGLRPYQRNPIQIEQEDLPIGAEVGDLDHLLTPRLRSGIYADFPIRQVRSLTFRIVGEDGTPLPAGALLQLQPDGNTFPVGYEGLAFISSENADNHIVGRWDDKQCEAHLILEDTTADQSESSDEQRTITCREVAP